MWLWTSNPSRDNAPYTGYMKAVFVPPMHDFIMNSKEVAEIVSKVRGNGHQTKQIAGNFLKNQARIWQSKNPRLKSYRQDSSWGDNKKSDSLALLSSAFLFPITVLHHSHFSISFAY
jgi:hypothetical protein